MSLTTVTAMDSTTVPSSMPIRNPVLVDNVMLDNEVLLLLGDSEGKPNGTISGVFVLSLSVEYLRFLTISKRSNLFGNERSFDNIFVEDDIFRELDRGLSPNGCLTNCCGGRREGAAINMDEL